MLDMGFKDELEKIFAAMGKTVDRQLLLVFCHITAVGQEDRWRVLPESDVVGGDRSGRWGQGWLEQDRPGLHRCQTYVRARVLLESKS